MVITRCIIGQQPTCSSLHPLSELDPRLVLCELCKGVLASASKPELINGGQELEKEQNSNLAEQLHLLKEPVELFVAGEFSNSHLGKLVHSINLLVKGEPANVVRIRQ